VHAIPEVPGAARVNASFRTVDLTLSFGPRDILAGVSADIRPGAITALTDRPGRARPRCCEP